jgi:hypothetical protein
MQTMLVYGSLAQALAGPTSRLLRTSLPTRMPPTSWPTASSCSTQTGTTTRYPAWGLDSVEVQSVRYSHELPKEGFWGSLKRALQKPRRKAPRSRVCLGGGRRGGRSALCGADAQRCTYLNDASNYVNSTQTGTTTRPRHRPKACDVGGFLIATDVTLI